MARILIAEDDLMIAEFIGESMIETGHQIEHAANGDDAQQFLETQTFDLLILDWNLPGRSGVELCKSFRKAGKKEPVIILTSRASIDDKEEGFDAGADDYLTKPFDPRELIARVKSLLRRPAEYRESVLVLGEIQIDMDGRTLNRDGTVLKIQPRELALLDFFMRRSGQLLSSEAIFTAVWGSDFEGSEIALRSCLAKLRKILAQLGYKDLIQTVHGSGYKFQKPGEI